MKDYVGCFTSDLHIRDSQPVGRLDDYQEYQKNVLKFIAGEAGGRLSNIFIAGDIFNGWNPAPSEYMIFKDFKEHAREIHLVAGNHDLKGNSMASYRVSGVGVLTGWDEKTHNLSLEGSKWAYAVHYQHPKPFDIFIQGYNFGEPLDKKPLENAKNILVIHDQVYDEFVMGYSTKSSNCEDILEKYKGFDLIVSGDNHKHFVHEGKDGRKILNCGAPTLQKVSEREYTPKIHFVTNDLEIESVDVPLFGMKWKEKDVPAFVGDEREFQSITLLGEGGAVPRIDVEDLLKRRLEDKPERVKSIIYEEMGK